MNNRVTKVATLDEHKSQYESNKILLNKELDIKTCPYYDWVVTVAFYSALHLVEGELAKCNAHCETHKHRNDTVCGNPMFLKIRSKYKALYDRSIVARYYAKPLNKKKAEEALMLLGEIEKTIKL